MDGMMKIAIALAIAGFAMLVLPWSISIWVIAAALWYVLGFQVIRENERGVMVFLGDPKSVVPSGLQWAPFLLGKFLRYPTGIVELDVTEKETRRAGIVTRKGKLPKSTDGTEQEDRIFGTANVGVDVSFRFRWPKEDLDLLQCVKLLPSPQDIPALVDIFQEPILDHVRTAGGKKIWVELARDRRGFAEEVNRSFRENITPVTNKDISQTGNIITDSHIEDPTVSIAHIEIPKALLDSLTVEEIAQQEKSATIIKAKSDKQKLILEGQGKADARKTFIEAISGELEGVRIQSLLTLEAMAQGQATTIFPIPTNLMDQLSDVFGKPAGLDLQQLIKGLNPKQKQELMQILAEALKPMQPRRRQS